MTGSSHILKRLSDWYKERMRIRWLDPLLKGALGGAVSLWARMRGFWFPEKYTWEWKVEMLSESYEKDTTDLFKKTVKPGMTVIDIGAHIGYFTRLFSKLAGPRGKVFAFEPDPYNFALLKKNTAHLPNVRIVNAAVSDAAGTIDFYEIEDSTGCHTTVPSSAPSKKLRVRAVAMDAFARENGIRADVIKMDIEGGEPKALLGMQEMLSKDAPLRIVMELNPDALAGSGTTPADVIASLKRRGFKGYGILAGGTRGPLSPDLAGMTVYEGKSDYANVLFEKEEGSR